jgi:hypothetical protein
LYQQHLRTRRSTGMLYNLQQLLLIPLSRLCRYLTTTLR